MSIAFIITVFQELWGVSSLSWEKWVAFKSSEEGCYLKSFESAIPWFPGLSFPESFSAPFSPRLAAAISSHLFLICAYFLKSPRNLAKYLDCSRTHALHLFFTHLTHLHVITAFSAPPAPVFISSPLVISQLPSPCYISQVTCPTASCIMHWTFSLFTFIRKTDT